MISPKAARVIRARNGVLRAARRMLDPDARAHSTFADWIAACTELRAAERDCPKLRQQGIRDADEDERPTVPEPGRQKPPTCKACGEYHIGTCRGMPAAKTLR
jgi:hypothetical protein